MNTKYKYIVLDTETTGVDTRLDEILQLSIIDQDGNVLFDEYFRPIAKSWNESMRINHITPAMVKNKKPITEYAKQIEEILEQALLIVGYNIEFDLAMLKREKISVPNTKRFDVMRKFAPIFGDYNEYHGDYTWQKLATAARYYKYDWSSHSSDAHNALADCYATQHVYLSMLSDYNKSLDESRNKAEKIQQEIQEQNDSVKVKFIVGFALVLVAIIIAIKGCSM